MPGSVNRKRPARSRSDHPPLDAIIIGGGPAGLSAALVLGRCRRSVLVIDAGRPRNHASQSMHNFLSRDGINPLTFLAAGRRQLVRYGVAHQRATVTAVTCSAAGFAVRVRGRRARLTSRTLLLATGVTDLLPDIENIRRFYGRGVHHCPYCDAWEYRDRPIAVYGEDAAGVGLARNLLTWSGDITVLTGGKPLPPGPRRAARLAGIKVREEPIHRLLSRRGRPGPAPSDPFARIVFRSGPPLKAAALFFNTGQRQRSRLPVALGCRLSLEGGVLHDKRQRTHIPGLFAAGDVSVDVQFVVVAAAQGATAGMTMNSYLQKKDRAR